MITEPFGVQAQEKSVQNRTREKRIKLLLHKVDYQAIYFFFICYLRTIFPFVLFF